MANLELQMECWSKWEKNQENVDAKTLIFPFLFLSVSFSLCYPTLSQHQYCDIYMNSILHFNKTFQIACKLHYPSQSDKNGIYLH